VSTALRIPSTCCMFVAALLANGQQNDVPLQRDFYIDV
jgi:hypothetical protein